MPFKPPACGICHGPPAEEHTHNKHSGLILRSCNAHALLPRRPSLTLLTSPAPASGTTRCSTDWYWSLCLFSSRTSQSDGAAFQISLPGTSPLHHHLSNKPFPQKLKLKSRACSLPHHPESCSAPCRGVNASPHVDDHFSTHTQGPCQPSSLCQCSLLRQLEERCPIGNCTPSLKHPVPPHRQASGSVWGQELATALGALLQLPCCPVPDNNPGPTTAQSCGQRLAASSCPAGAVSPEQG